MTQPSNKLSRFWQELKRRKVIYFLIAYVAACFAIIGFILESSEAFPILDNTIKPVYLLAAVGLPVVIILPWIINRRKKVLIRDKSFVYDNSIAVLPFQDMSPHLDQEYFCDGMTEEIINALTHVGSLKVIARTSAFAFKGKQEDMREIGNKLDVETLLEGSIRKEGSKLRITAQLIKTSDGSHIWSERFDRDMTDVFSIQDEISLAIVDILKIKLLGEEKAEILRHYTENLEAYNLYLKGSHIGRLLTAEGCDKSIDYYNQALQKDPKFALAYVGLAIAYWLSTIIGNKSPIEAFPNAITYVNNALQIDDSLDEAHAAMGIINTYYNWNWKNAEENFHHALQLNSNSVFTHVSYSMLMLCTERYEEAITLSKKAYEIDPLSRETITQLAMSYHFDGQINKAIEQYQETISNYPDHYLAYFSLSLLYSKKLMFRKTRLMYKKAAKIAQDAPLLESARAVFYKSIGKNEKAYKVLNSLKTRLESEYIPSSYFYLIYRNFGENDRAFEWLERACIERDSLLPLLSVHPDNQARIPDEPRNNDLLKEFGLRDNSNYL